MKILLTLITAVTMVVGAAQSQAQNLLTGGGLEASLPGWKTTASITGRPDLVISASEQVGFANEPAPITDEYGIWFQAYAGNAVGGGDFNSDRAVDGTDFLAWQRNLGILTGATKEQGDSNADGKIDAADLTEWKSRFSRRADERVNVALTQSVPGTAGETYTLKGHSLFEGNYAGGAALLPATSPSDPGMTGTVPTPTRTTFELAFLNASNAVIGTPVIKELRIDDGQSNINFWMEHTLSGMAPAGTSSVRVTAAATDMVNVGADPQSAFIDNFTLEGASAPGVDKLIGGNFNALPSVQGWTLTELPEGTDSAGYQSAEWAARTGNTGLWLKAFSGDVEPIDAILSQTVPGVAGGTYTFSAWSRWEANFSGGAATLTGGPLTGMPSPTQTTLEIAFLDAASAVIGTPVTLNLKTAGQLNDNTWREFSTMGVAPAGTASVRVSASAVDMVLNVDPGQSAFWDDLSLTVTGAVGASGAVPEPASAVGAGMFTLIGVGYARRRKQFPRPINRCVSLLN